jgi:hypothetical protein
VLADQVDTAGRADDQARVNALVPLELVANEVYI